MDGLKAEYVDHMGSDLSVVNAARVSFDKVSDWDVSYDCEEFCGIEVLPDSDTKLINYLAKHNHWTPFAHTSISLRTAAPVPIRTQCFKHKSGFVENEESRRYISGTPEVFIPEFRVAAENVKQGSGGLHPENDYWREYYEQATHEAVCNYKAMVSDGVCPEQARFILPQGAIVNWIWTGNLVSFARYYNQRTDSHAQLEGCILAKQVGEIVGELYPVSWAALTGGKS